MPDPRELPRMLGAVVPLVGARNTVVDELVPDGLPCLAAVVRALDDLPEPAARLRGVQPVGVGRRPVDVVDLPAREQGAVDVPLVARPVGRQDERTLLGSYEQP